MRMLAKHKRVITPFVLVMLNVSIMASLRNLPLVAELGTSLVFFFVLVAIVFLIPAALVSAELATGWSEEGGIYIWVREALGDRMGFVAIFLQTFHNIPWFPAILSFVAACIYYAIDPTRELDKYFVLGVTLVFFWGMTFLNYFGIKTSGLFSTIGVIIGTLMPGVLIIALAAYWITTGDPIQIDFSPKSFIPDITDIRSLVFLAGLFLAFAGLEVSAGYANEVKNPQKNYPRAIISAAIIVFFLFCLGSLAIAMIIPKHEISLVQGLLDAFDTFLSRDNLSYLMPPIAIALVFGALAETNSWIIGPIKALHATSQNGDLPRVFQKENKHGAPANLLFLQAIIVSIVACIFLFTPNLSTAYWILSAGASQIYLTMYILMFISGIRLRYSHSHVERSYKIPHPHKGMWVVASTGIVAAAFAIIIGFFPPTQLDVGNVYVFESFLIFDYFAMIALPFIVYSFRKPAWRK